MQHHDLKKKKGGKAIAFVQFCLPPNEGKPGLESLCSREKDSFGQRASVSVFPSQVQRVKWKNVT